MSTIIYSITQFISNFLSRTTNANDLRGAARVTDLLPAEINENYPRLSKFYLTYVRFCGIIRTYAEASVLHFSFALWRGARQPEKPFAKLDAVHHQYPKAYLSPFQATPPKRLANS